LYISTPELGAMMVYLPEIRKISTVAPLILHIGDHGEIADHGMNVVVVIGKAGEDGGKNK